MSKFKLKLQVHWNSWWNDPRFRMALSFVAGALAQGVCGTNEQCSSAATALIGMCF